MEAWIQFGSVILTILGTTYYIHRDIKEDHREFKEQLRAQTSRTDTLYQMFVDLLKERK